MKKLWAKVDSQGNIIPETIKATNLPPRNGYVRVTQEQIDKGNIN